MSDRCSYVRSAFGIICREIPGSWEALRGHLEAAPTQVQEEFFRVLRAFEDEIAQERRTARQPWARPRF